MWKGLALMELHGSDIIFRDVKVSISEDNITPIVRKHWPDLVYEAMMEDGDLHLFMHPTQIAEEAWNEEGWSEENDKTLIYMIWDKAKCELTFVIDDNRENRFIVYDIQKVLGF